jgi:hypothetical protein
MTLLRDRCRRHLQFHQVLLRSLRGFHLYLSRDLVRNPKRNIKKDQHICKGSNWKRKYNERTNISLSPLLKLKAKVDLSVF